MKNLENELIALRRHFHKHPELSFKEYGTQKYIIKIFEKFNCVIHRVSTGLLVLFDNNKDNTIAFRCEEDALNIKEKNDVDYKSINDYSHACGHDGHMSILIMLGKYINDNLDILNNNYMLIFEHGEETIGGAREIIQNDFYLSHLPKYVFGLHVYPNLRKGNIFLKEGFFISKATEFDIEVRGKSSHVASKENGLDALMEGVNLIHSLESKLSYMEDIRYLFGTFKSGMQRNVVSDYANIKGTFRVFDVISFDIVKNIIEDVISKIRMRGFDVEISYNENMPVYNDPFLVEKIKKIHCTQDINKLYIGESFGFYQKYSMCAYALLGIDSSSLHSDNFDFDDSVLIYGFNYFKSLLNIE